MHCSNWNNREINLSSTRRESTYSWTKRGFWPSSCWKMAKKSRAEYCFPIYTFLTFSVLHKRCLDCSDKAVKAIPCKWLVLGVTVIDRWIVISQNCDIVVTPQEGLASSQEETLPGPATRQNRKPDFKPGTNGDVLTVKYWLAYVAILFKNASTVVKICELNPFRYAHVSKY